MQTLNGKLGIAFGGALATAIVAMSPLASSAEAERTAAPRASTARAITTVAASKPDISFGQCHFQKTPPFEPRMKLECASGEVVVAVFEDGVRCCELVLR